MKKFVLTFLFVIGIQFVFSQKTYTVKGEELLLIKEVDGILDLLWNVVDGKYRYFVEKDGNLTELTNTRGEDKRFKEEYKVVLSSVGGLEPSELGSVRLTLYSLTEFFNTFNKEKDPGFKETDLKPKLQARILFYSGITNHPFIINDDNASNLIFGTEIEVFENRDRPKHSLLFQLNHSPNGDKFEYTSTQLAIGYRFRAVSTPKWSLYGTVIGANYTFSRFETSVADQVFDESDNSFDAPFSFGVGTDIKIFENGFLTVSYDELFAIFVDNQGNFSKRITAGIKLSL